jgi:formylglycine-generating enzyme required for sulfatase activity
VKLLAVGLLAVAIACLPGCAAEPAVRPQWVVTLRTDAPVPLVGDRLLIEVVGPDGDLACDACRRVLDAGDAAAWPVSFGVVPIAGPLTVRARLHRVRAIDRTGAPDARTTIDAVARLPSAPERISIPLVMRCFGVASTPEQSCAPETGQLAPIALAPSGDGDPTMSPGSWAEAASDACKDAPPADMACAPGGLFYFGGIGTVEDRREVLVRVGAFLIDRDEMTVGRARRVLAEQVTGELPFARTNDRTSSDVCTYRGLDDASADDLPLNCVSRSLAAALCAAEGKRLPIDAELAYVAGNGGASTQFPWGADERLCEHAVVARGGTTLEIEDSELAIECRTHAGAVLPFGPAAGGSNLDQNRDGIRNLGGNLAEWVEDDYSTLDGPCWAGSYRVAAPCRQGPVALARGGAWSFPAWTASARTRTAVPRGPHAAVGVRCVR